MLFYDYCSKMSVIHPTRTLLKRVFVTSTVIFALVSPLVVVHSAGAAKPSKITWVDQKVSFLSGTMTIYATFRHPENDAKVVPGVLLIAGSGPTDRNGNSAIEPGPVNTLKTLADWLSEDGVASLRYDKLGSGQTGLGPYAVEPDSIGVSVFEQESRSALEFLAKEKDVNDRRVGCLRTQRGRPLRVAARDRTRRIDATHPRVGSVRAA